MCYLIAKMVSSRAGTQYRRLVKERGIHSFSCVGILVVFLTLRKFFDDRISENQLFCFFFFDQILYIFRISISKHDVFHHTFPHYVCHTLSIGLVVCNLVPALINFSHLNEEDYQGVNCYIGWRDRPVYIHTCLHTNGQLQFQRLLTPV